jgi:hypothetical protein
MHGACRVSSARLERRFREAVAGVEAGDGGAQRCNGAARCGGYQQHKGPPTARVDACAPEAYSAPPGGVALVDSVVKNDHGASGEQADCACF